MNEPEHRTVGTMGRKTRRKLSRLLREVMDQTATDDTRIKAAAEFILTLGADANPLLPELFIERKSPLSDVDHNAVSKLHDLLFGEPRVPTDVVHCWNPTLCEQLADALWENL